MGEEADLKRWDPFYCHDGAADQDAMRHTCMGFDRPPEELARLQSAFIRGMKMTHERKVAEQVRREVQAERDAEAQGRREAEALLAPVPRQRPPPPPSDGPPRLPSDGFAPAPRAPPDPEVDNLSDGDGTLPLGRYAL